MTCPLRRKRERAPYFSLEGGFGAGLLSGFDSVLVSDFVSADFVSDLPSDWPFEPLEEDGV